MNVLAVAVRDRTAHSFSASSKNASARTSLAPASLHRRTSSSYSIRRARSSANRAAAHPADPRLSMRHG